MVGAGRSQQEFAPLVEPQQAFLRNGHLRKKLLRQRKTKESERRPVRGIAREMWFEEVNTAASMGHMNNVAELSEPKSVL
jgi:hypothetical protein